MTCNGCKRLSAALDEARAGLSNAAADFEALGRLDTALWYRGSEERARAALAEQQQESGSPGGAPPTSTRPSVDGGSRARVSGCVSPEDGSQSGATESPCGDAPAVGHSWDDEGDHCVRCGGAAWMGGPCVPKQPAPEQDVVAAGGIDRPDLVGVVARCAQCEEVHDLGRCDTAAARRAADIRAAQLLGFQPVPEQGGAGKAGGET